MRRVPTYPCTTSINGKFKFWNISSFILRFFNSTTPENIEKLVLVVSISTILDKKFSNIKFKRELVI